MGFMLALHALPTIVFFMALTAGLYQLGILQRVVRLFSRLFVKTLGASGAESLGVASLMFVGVESAGMVRPFYPSSPAASSSPCSPRPWLPWPPPPWGSTS